MPRITKVPEERKQEIVETALTLFSEKGYENTSIQDIADRMNVATGLCYRYFKSKQEIFAATSEYYAKLAVEKLQISLPVEAPALEKFNFVIKSLFEYAIQHNEFEASYQKEPEISANRLDQMVKQIMLKIIPIVEQGVSDGVFHCVDIPNTVYFLTCGIIHMIHNEMPTKNPQEHIILFIPLIKEMCVDILKIQSQNDLGVGWENL